jgi:hypothetical protein
VLYVAGSIKGSAFEKLKNVEPIDVGREQFYRYQTHGEYKHERFLSKELDPYFFVLKEGKHQFDLITREYQQMYVKGEWSGFYSLWRDWEGHRWMLKHICKWHQNIPEWLYNDEEPDITI